MKPKQNEIIHVGCYTQAPPSGDTMPRNCPSNCFNEQCNLPSGCSMFGKNRESLSMSTDNIEKKTDGENEWPHILPYSYFSSISVFWWVNEQMIIFLTITSLFIYFIFIHHFIIFILFQWVKTKNSYFRIFTSSFLLLKYILFTLCATNRAQIWVVFLTLKDQIMHCCVGVCLWV